MEVGLLERRAAPAMRPARPFKAYSKRPPLSAPRDKNGKVRVELSRFEGYKPSQWVVTPS